MPKRFQAPPRTIVVFLGGALVLAACLARWPVSLAPLPLLWLTAAVYITGLALVLVAFGYCYRPVSWLRTLAQCAVVAAVALMLSAAVLAWHDRRPASHPLPAAAIAGSAKR